jgi:hypothetical protein
MAFSLNTASRERMVEHLGVFAHRVGEGGAGFHVILDGGDHLLEGRVGLLLAENLQALHQRQTGVDHG